MTISSPRDRPRIGPVTSLVRDSGHDHCVLSTLIVADFTLKEKRGRLFAVPQLLRKFFTRSIQLSPSEMRSTCKCTMECTQRTHN